MLSRRKIVSRKLCASVKLYRDALFYLTRDADVRHDERVCSAKIRRLCRAEIFLTLAIKYERVCGNVNLHSVGVCARDRGLQLVGGEVFGVDTRVEGESAHVDSVSAPLYCGVKRQRRACRC